MSDAGVIDRIVHFFVVNEDPRTKSWLLSSSPGPLFTILVTYLFFCLYAGPRYMKNRKPFKLKSTLIVYNAIQVVLSVYLVIEGLEGGWRKHYNFICQPIDYSNNPIAMRMARAVWLYYMCKISELLDTVFFVLRKKQNQITFLHIYHHTLMPFCGFIGLKYFAGMVCSYKPEDIAISYKQTHLSWEIICLGLAPLSFVGVATALKTSKDVLNFLSDRNSGRTVLQHENKPILGGHGTLMGLINSFVHAIMYTYYMLAAMGQQVQKHLWWKKYLTVMQIIQFLILSVHTIQIQFQPSCNYPKSIGWLLTLNAGLFAYMFSSFYIKSYNRATKTEKCNGLDYKCSHDIANGKSNGLVSSPELDVEDLSPNTKKND